MEDGSPAERMAADAPPEDAPDSVHDPLDGDVTSTEADSAPAKSNGAGVEEPPVFDDASIPKKHVRQLFQLRWRHLVDVSLPLVLISQPTRSGGTLLSQLFDGHTQLHSHPFELEIGHPRKSAWPALDLNDSPDTWFESLAEPHTGRLFTAGYRKDTRQGERDDAFPFMFVPSFQRSLFMRALERREPTKPRDILDCYWTSYFNAWIDNHNLYDAGKRWVVGFRSGLGKPSNLPGVFADYPDGRLVSALRDPKSVMASKIGLDPAFAGRLEDHVHQYALAAQARIEAKERFGDQIFLLTYEHLVTDPEVVMRAVAAWMGIEYQSILAVPTFNRMPIKGNSSYKVDQTGVFVSSRKRWRSVLSDEQAAFIDEATAPTHRELLRLAYDQPFSPRLPKDGEIGKVLRREIAHGKKRKAAQRRPSKRG
jgi:Sulfotransferase family